VTLALRPEAVIIETAGASAAADGVPNMTPAVIEQIIYHGFATHLHLRLPNGDPLIAFEQNRGGWISDRSARVCRFALVGHRKAARSSEMSANNPCPPAAAALARETAASRRC